MFAQPDNPVPLQQKQQQQQQQVVIDLPQSPRQRQKAFSSTVVGFVKAGDGESALQLYGRAAEAGCNISENVFNAVLSVCDGDKGMGVLSDMIAAGIKPRENHYAFILREAAGRGAFEEAFSQVQQMVEGGVQPRLRTYSPLLKGLCNKPDMALAMKVWSHMKAQGVQPTPEEYVNMIKGWAAAGELRQRVKDGSVEAFLGQLGDMAFELSPSREASGQEVSGAGAEEGDSRSGKAGFLETLLVAFNSDSISSSRSGDVQAYYSSSAVPVASVSSASPETGGVCDCCGATLKVVGLDAPARACVRSALIRLGAETTCSMPPPPSPQPRARQSSRLDSAFAVGEDRAVTKQGGDPRQAGGAMGDLEQFATWLEERRREGVKFTTVVDGCNVAYYGQNKEGGKFQISQVDLLAKQLEEEGERVLVVLPERYLRPCVPNSARSRRGKNPPSALSDEDLRTIEGWRQRQMVYSCANGADDDLFWMYFTVSPDAGDYAAREGGVAIEGEEGNVPHVNGHREGGGDSGAKDDCGNRGGPIGGAPRGGAGGGNSGGAWEKGDRRVEPDTCSCTGIDGGARLTVVSNDEMRNHRMALLEPVPFKRWRNSQVRGFHFPLVSPAEEPSGPSASATSSAGGKEVSERDRHSPTPTLDSPPPPPIVSPAPSFTRDMQVLKHAWHIPIRGQQDGEPSTRWLCINLASLVDEDGGGQVGIRPSERTASVGLLS
eukprot:g17931.t1